MLQETKSKTKKPAVKQQAGSATKSARKPRAQSAKSKTQTHITPEQRQAMIQVAAYYIAEREGFSGQSPLDCWLMAEAEIDQQLLQQPVK